MNTSEVLYRAADLIEQRGWGQGPATWSGDKLCLEGGVAAALNWAKDPILLNPVPYEDFQSCPAYRAVQDYLGQRVTSDARLWEWNDDLGRTAEQVIEVLRAAAVIEAARESEAAQVSA